MKSRILNLVILFFVLGTFQVVGQENDALLRLMKEELKYNMEELKKQEFPPYYMNLRATETYNVNIVSSFGAVASSRVGNQRILTPQIRLGSPELDNFKYLSQGMRAARGRQVTSVNLPLEDKFPEAVREAIWTETLRRYKFALDVFEQTKAKAAVSVEDEDKTPCFSSTPVEQYYEAPLDPALRTIDTVAWEKRLNEVSAVFKSCPELQQGSASLTFEMIRTWFVNSEGTSVVKNRIAARLMISASIKADDGMDLPLNKDYFAFDLSKLPSNDVLIADAKDMVARLNALKNAPVADPYTGPAILSGPASGVFFHEIFGHRLEGHRMKTGGQTFKKMVGDNVLPKDFDVYCDPTLTHYAETALNGHYLYDDEGVKARRVDNVIDGVLNEFLMNRVPIEGFPASNGHGRTSGANDPVSRQSNLIIETSNPYTEAELRNMLIEEAKRQGKEYGYYMRTVTSGFTFTGEGGSLNSFSVTPLEVYRVFVDGRPDQLVRGVDMIGTPLSMFANIVAGGDDPTVFTGMCGAESGWVPVTACSPTIFVSLIETQRRAQSRNIPPILPAPTTKTLDETDADKVIFSAMKDELDRNQAGLVLPGRPKPYYLSYLLHRGHRFQIVGTLGSVLGKFDLPRLMVGAVQVMMGNYEKNCNARYVEMVMPTGLASEINYDAIRRGFWSASDNMYRFSLNNYVQKNAFLKANPLPEAEANTPDMQAGEAVNYIGTRTKDYVLNLDELEVLVKELSAVFLDYPQLMNTSVVVNGLELDIYRLSTEGLKLKAPGGYINVIARAGVRTDNGSIVNHSYSLTKETPGELPTLEELKKQVKAFADDMMALKSAPLIEEYYSGPVMFENSAASTLFTKNLLYHGGLYAQRRPLQKTDAKMLEDQLGRKILDERLTIKNYTNVKEYNGEALIGHYEIDGEGFKPAEETLLVENGVLKNLLNGRIPTPKVQASTGSGRFMLSPENPSTAVSGGTIHISVEKGMSPEKMKKALLKAAKEKDLTYAYIVRSIAGEASKIYRVNVKDGKETLVSGVGLTFPDLTKLDEIRVISSKENVLNYFPNQIPCSLIYPSAVIMDDIEIVKKAPKAEKAPAITAPLQRK